MGIVNRAEAIDVTDYTEMTSKTDPQHRLPDEIRQDKRLTLNTIIINGVWFNGVSRDSSLGWEEFVWSQEPTRSNAFAFENMDTIDVGLVAQCQINFKYFNIEDFKKFREAIKQRYFRCTFFNVDTGEWEYNREMYCSKSERQKLYYFNPKLLGVLDFSVTLVATNRDIIKQQQEVPVQISFNKNGYTSLVVSSPVSVKYGDQYYVPQPSALSGYTFSHWDTKGDGAGGGSGFQYKAGDSFTAFHDIKLFAVYKAV